MNDSRPLWGPSIASGSKVTLPRRYGRCAGCSAWVADPRPKPDGDPEKLFCRAENCYPEPKAEPAT